MNPPLNSDFSNPINLPDFSGLDLNFEIIDAHHHLFDLDEVYYPWLTDEPEKHFLLGNYDALKRNYSCCLLYTSPSPRDRTRSRMPSSA